ncbi:hypothetical protein [Burkholderia vietnamiensis]|uniref:hypothetical protein n=1 Tax=Burkholderia vietnamiensis TaxID=60552 RepID=UPI001B9F97E2|nr:hypothetical protein [Burkholderia vietnamiensis]MBR8054177.1 hypothetical protein [Burkholderia vietnamiensis]
MFHVKSFVDIVLQASACALMVCAFFPARRHIRLQLLAVFAAFLCTFLVLYA